MPAKEAVEPRLWRKVNKTDTCWLWLGTTTKDGHGLIKCDGKNVGVHVVSWMLHNGEWPLPGQLVCHDCDKPNCVHPAHLYLGSKIDNNHDMLSRNPGLASFKLTQVQVDEIRSLGRSYSQAKLAKMYGVNPSTIHRILNYKRRTVVSAY